MKSLLHSIIITMLFSGCGVSVLQMGTDLSYAEKQLINGVDVNARYEDGETVLFWAAKEGSKVLVDFYLSKGADINAKNKWGSTPLHWAVYANQFSMLKHLVSKGADITAKDVAGDTVLTLAQSENFKHLIDYLTLLVKIEQPAFVKAKKENTLQGYKVFKQKYSQSAYLPLVETLMEQRTKILFDDPQEIEKIKAKLTSFISAKKMHALMDYIKSHQKALIYAKNDDVWSLLFVGPKDLSVGEVLAYHEQNYGELVLAAKIKGLKKPYKDFSFAEIKELKNMGLTDILLAAMLEVSH